MRAQPAVAPYGSQARRWRTATLGKRKGTGVMKRVYAVAIALATIGVVCSAQTTQTNAPVSKESVFVEIKETGTREDRHSRLVVGAILECLGYWPCQTKIEEGYFTSLVETINSDKNAGPFIARCVEQKTLSPTGERADTYIDFIFALAHRPQEHPVRLAPFSPQDIRVTITLSWGAGGSYGVMGGPAIAVSKPTCDVLVLRPDGTKSTFNFVPKEQSSYTRGWPIVYWSEDIRNFVVLLHKELNLSKQQK